MCRWQLASSRKLLTGLFTFRGRRLLTCGQVYWKMLSLNEASSTLCWRIFENSAFFFYSVMPTVHTNPLWKRSLSNTPLRLKKNWKRWLRVLLTVWTEGAIRKPWSHNNHVISLPEFSANTNPKWLVIVTFSSFLGILWAENIWCVFRENSVFKFLRRSLDRGLRLNKRQIFTFLFIFTEKKSNTKRVYRTYYSINDSKISKTCSRLIHCDSIAVNELAACFANLRVINAGVCPINAFGVGLNTEMPVTEVLKLVIITDL